MSAPRSSTDNANVTEHRELQLIGAALAGAALPPRARTATELAQLVPIDSIEPLGPIAATGEKNAFRDRYHNDMRIFLQSQYDWPMEQQNSVFQMLACGVANMPTDAYDAAGGRVMHKDIAKNLRINAELLWVWYNLDAPITEAILGEELQIALPSFLIVYDRPFCWEFINDFAFAILNDVESKLNRRKLHMGITLHHPEEDTDDEGLADIDELVADDDDTATERA